MRSGFTALALVFAGISATSLTPFVADGVPLSWDAALACGTPLACAALALAAALQWPRSRW